MAKINIGNIDKFHIMIIKNIIWAIIGVVLGIIINDSVIYLANEYNIKNLFIQNIIQLTMCSLVVAFLHTYYLFGWDWQNLSPDLFFISFFFGVQYKIMNNIQNTYVIDSNNNSNKK